MLIVIAEITIYIRTADVSYPETSFYLEHLTIPTNYSIIFVHHVDILQAIKSLICNYSGLDLNILKRSLYKR